jgi:hypothetical protein
MLKIRTNQDKKWTVLKLIFQFLTTMPFLLAPATIQRIPGTAY